ncbi:MAG: hypothetical protein HQ567_00610 [Candidatus Nealsonbacteria bacterium]|nr:hypothetical protein [Candidatus Nealsonbacteria bacterium]
MNRKHRKPKTPRPRHRRPRGPNSQCRLCGNRQRVPKHEYAKPSPPKCIACGAMLDHLGKLLHINR